MTARPRPLFYPAPLDSVAEFRWADDDRTNGMPTPASLEADGWQRGAQHPNRRGVWLMRRPSIPPSPTAPRHRRPRLDGHTRAVGRAPRDLFLSWWQDPADPKHPLRMMGTPTGPNPRRAWARAAGEREATRQRIRALTKILTEVGVLPSSALQTARTLLETPATRGAGPLTEAETWERAARLHEQVNPASDAERLAGHPGAGAMGAVLEYRDLLRASARERGATAPPAPFPQSTPVRRPEFCRQEAGCLFPEGHPGEHFLITPAQGPVRDG